MLFRHTRPGDSTELVKVFLGIYILLLLKKREAGIQRLSKPIYILVSPFSRE